MSEKSEPTALGRLLSAQGVDDWDELFQTVCKKCSFQSLCDEAAKMKVANGCKAIALIGGLAAQISAKSDAGHPVNIRNFVQGLREMLRPRIV